MRVITIYDDEEKKIVTFVSILCGIKAIKYNVSRKKYKRGLSCKLLSWASSKTTKPYLHNNGSDIASLNNIPSVTYIILVVLSPRISVESSNRTRCPTIVPGVQLTSDETRFANVIAATRRGCVIQIDLPYLCFLVGDDFDDDDDWDSCCDAFDDLVNIPDSCI
jgi:hypothetical protein